MYARVFVCSYLSSSTVSTDLRKRTRRSVTNRKRNRQTNRSEEKGSEMRRTKVQTDHDLQCIVWESQKIWRRSEIHDWNYEEKSMSVMRNEALETEIILMEIWTLTKCIVHDRVRCRLVNGRRDTKTHLRDMLCQDEKGIFFFERRSDGSEIMFNLDDGSSEWKKHDMFRWDHFVYWIDSYYLLSFFIERDTPKSEMSFGLCHKWDKRNYTKRQWTDMWYVRISFADGTHHARWLSWSRDSSSE